MKKSVIARTTRRDCGSTNAQIAATRLAATRLATATLGLALLASSLGCRGGNPFFAAPGPLNNQQASAVIHDPYPDRDIAPYDAGSRPPGYENPLPEPVRNRIVKDSMPWLGR